MTSRDGFSEPDEVASGFGFHDWPTMVKLLGAHGLHLATAADKAVLDAGNLVLDSSLRRLADENGGCIADWARAELARRAALR